MASSWWHRDAETEKSNLQDVTETWAGKRKRFQMNHARESIQSRMLRAAGHLSPTSSVSFRSCGSYSSMSDRTYSRTSSRTDASDRSDHTSISEYDLSASTTLPSLVSDRGSDLKVLDSVLKQQSFLYIPKLDILKLPIEAPPEMSKALRPPVSKLSPQHTPQNNHSAYQEEQKSFFIDVDTDDEEEQIVEALQLEETLEEDTFLRLGLEMEGRDGALSEHVSEIYRHRETQQTESSSTSSTSIAESTNVPSLESNQSSTDALLPVSSILLSRSRLILLPGIYPESVVERLTTLGCDLKSLTISQAAYSGDGRGSNQAKRVSDSTLGSKISRVGKSNGGSSTRSGLSSNSGQTEIVRKRARKTTVGKRFGCPFAKHNPPRYESVHNACTLPKGIEWKHVVEHVERVHGKKACPWCGKQWQPDESWIEELGRHTVNEPCCQPDVVATKSEPLSRSQQIALHEFKSERHNGTSAKRWIDLFVALFPDEYPIPSPYYDFYTATHLVRQPPTPISHSNDATSPQPSQQPVALHSPMLLASTGLEYMDPTLDALEFDPIILGFDTIQGNSQGANRSSIETSLLMEDAWEAYTAQQGLFGLDLATTDGVADRKISKLPEGQEAGQFLEECISGNPPVR